MSGYAPSATPGAEFYSFEHMRRIVARAEPAHLLGGPQEPDLVPGGHDGGGAPDGHRVLPPEGPEVAAPHVPDRAPVAVLQAPRARDRAHAARVPEIYFEMQELWLLTRIRRDDYWFLGDLRRLGPRFDAGGEADLGPRARRRGPPAGRGPRTAGCGGRRARRDDDRTARRRARGAGEPGRRSCAARWPSGPAPCGPDRCVVRRHRKGSAGPGARVRAALVGLRLPDLPPAPPPSSFRRRVKRLNPFSLDRLEHDPALTAYWRRTRRAVARLELWRLNPLVLTWNLVRGTRQALAFLVACTGSATERASTPAPGSAVPPLRLDLTSPWRCAQLHRHPSAINARWSQESQVGSVHVLDAR